MAIPCRLHGRLVLTKCLEIHLLELPKYLAARFARVPQIEVSELLNLATSHLKEMMGNFQNQLRARLS